MTYEASVQGESTGSFEVRRGRWRRRKAWMSLTATSHDLVRRDVYTHVHAECIWYDPLAAHLPRAVAQGVHGKFEAMVTASALATMNNPSGTG